MGKIKAVFFDNDGVLVDTEKFYFEANQFVFAKHGIELTAKDYVENFLKKGRGTWHLLKDKNYSEEMISELRAERNEIYLKLITEKSEAIDGAEEVLMRLHGKVLIGIVTSSRKDHFEAIHNRTGFKKYFDFVLTSDDTQNVKPDPEPYLKALERSGFKKDECVIIEDSERGLKAALGAGIRCYIIPTQLTRSSNFTGAEKVLSGIKEIVSAANIFE